LRRERKGATLTAADKSDTEAGDATRLRSVAHYYGRGALA